MDKINLILKNKQNKLFGHKLFSILGIPLGNKLLIDLVFQQQYIIEVQIKEEFYLKNRLYLEAIAEYSRMKIKFRFQDFDHDTKVTKIYNSNDFMKIILFHFARKQDINITKIMKLLKPLNNLKPLKQRYFKIKQKNITSRDFNILIPKKGDVISKSSIFNSKIVSEINWMNKTKNLQLTPTMYDYNLEGEARYDLKYLKHFSISELLLHFDISSTNLEKLNLSVERTFLQLWGNNVEYKSILAQNIEMYIDKTLERYDLLINQDNFVCRLAYHKISVKWIERELGQLISNLERTVKKLGNDFSLIHGDPVFSNLIISNKFNKTYLIDPRGAYSDLGAFGSKSYDLSKLSQSLNSGYDSINTDLFIFNGVNDINIYTNENYTLLSKFLNPFLENIAKNIGLDLNDLAYLESSLWISLAPLHKENPDRQLVSLLKGLRIAK